MERFWESPLDQMGVERDQVVVERRLLYLPLGAAQQSLDGSVSSHDDVRPSLTRCYKALASKPVARSV